MKRLITSLTALLFATHLLAQNPYEGVFTVEEKGIITTTVYDKDLNVHTYEGDEIVAGVIQTSVHLHADNKHHVDIIPPADFTIHSSFTDVYGRVVMNTVDKKRLEEAFATLQFVTSYNANTHIASRVMRGGKYIYKNYIPAFNYCYEQFFEVKDNPSVYVVANKVKAGQDFKVKAYFNTGYPYNPSDFNKDMKATLRLYALGKDSEGNDTETELVMAQKPLQLYRPDEPDVAAIDILQLNLCDVQPGEYLAKLSSDCTLDGANRDDIYINVCDTLRASARLLKPTFDASVDKVFKVHLKMKYGYPYIQKQETDERPTVHVYTTIVSKHMEEGIEVTDVVDEQKTHLADDKYGTQGLDWEGDIDFTELKYQENTPLERTNLEAQVRVEFNGETQYTATLPFVYIPASQTAVRQIERPATIGADAVWYDLQGRRQPDASMLGKGLYLTNGQKIVK